MRGARSLLSSARPSAIAVAGVRRRRLSDLPAAPAQNAMPHGWQAPVGYAEPLRCQTEVTQLSRISDVASLHNDILSLDGDNEYRRESIA